MTTRRKSVSFIRRSSPLQRQNPAGTTRAWLAGLLALGGCAVGPDYKAPSTALAPFHNAASVDARNHTPLPPMDSWWTAFHDPTLEALIKRALAQNLDLAASFARVQQARSAAQGAEANLFPTIDANASATAMRQSLNGPLGKLASGQPGYHRDQQLYDAGGAATWEIDIAGGLRRGEEAADTTAQAAQADLAGVRVTVVADVADAYIQVRRDQAEISTVEQQIEVDSRLLALVRQLREHGLGNERETAQAEAVLKQAQATLPPLRIALESQLNRLDVLLGEQPGTNAIALAKPSAIPSVPAVPDTATDFLRRRPDIIAAERRLAASNARIGEALAEYYPKLSLSGVLGFDSLSANHFLTAASFQPAATGALRWRLFDFGKIDAEVGSARGANAEALARYRQTVLLAAEDVEDAFKSLVELEARTAELQSEVQSLQRARDLSQQAFAAGSSPLTDVLDADRQLLLAKDSLAQNQGDATRAAVRSFRALGGGWSG